MSTKIALQISGDDLLGPLSFTVSGIGEAGIDSAQLVAGTNQFNIAFPVSATKLKLLTIVCTQPAIVEFNTSAHLTPGTASDDISLLANVPFLWYPGCGFALSAIVAAPVTVVYVRPTGTPGVLDLRARFDPTP